MSLVEAVLRRQREEALTRVDSRQLAPSRVLPKLTIVPHKGGWPVSCVCGNCRKCRNREAMRARRANAPKPQPLPRGPRMILGRVCGHVYRDGRKCTTKIADWSPSGLCRCHRSQAWDSVNRVRNRSKAERGIAA